MSPEREISIREGNSMYGFIRGKGEELFIITPENKFQGEKFKVAIAGKKGNGPKIDILSFALVDGEPIVIYGDSSESCNERTLLCSKKHAKELGKRGIIKPTKTPKRKSP